MERNPNFNFQQPLVTASGIILGLARNFAPDRIRLGKKKSISFLASTLTGIIVLVVSLYRILNNRYDKGHADPSYKMTLNNFPAWVIFFFFGTLVKMTYPLMIS